MNTYLLGTDVLGADTIPTVDQTYTDTATVTAVQRGLIASGYKLPKYGADGNYGEETATAIRKFQKDMGVAQTGKIDYYVVAALKGKGSAPQKITFDDEVITSTILQTKQASTAPQVQAAAAKVAQISTDSSVSPEVKAEAAAAQQAAAAATTPAQIQAAKEQVQAVAEKVKASKGMPAWKIGLIAGGSAVGVALVVGLLARTRSTSVARAR